MANPREFVPYIEAAASQPTETTASFVDRVKREYASLNGVDVNKVTVEFRITA